MTGVDRRAQHMAIIVGMNGFQSTEIACTINDCSY
jgi:hypothetical protein